MRMKGPDFHGPLGRGELGSHLILLNVGQKKTKLQFFFVEENHVAICFSCSFKKKKIGWLFNFHFLLSRDNYVGTQFSLRKINLSNHSISSMLKNKTLKSYFSLSFSNIIDHKMNIWFCLMFLM